MKHFLRSIGLVGLISATTLASAQAPAGAGEPPKHNVTIAVLSLDVHHAGDPGGCGNWRKLSFDVNGVLDLIPDVEPFYVNTKDGWKSSFDLCASHEPYDVPQTDLTGLAKKMQPWWSTGLFRVLLPGNINRRTIQAVPGSDYKVASYGEEVDYSVTTPATPVAEKVKIPAPGLLGPVTLHIFVDTGGKRLTAMTLHGIVSTSLKPA